MARVHLQEHQETIVSLRESVSAKADEMSRIQGDLAHTHTALEVQVFFNLNNWEMASDLLCNDRKQAVNLSKFESQDFLIQF